MCKIKTLHCRECNKNFGPLRAYLSCNRLTQVQGQTHWCPLLREDKKEPRVICCREHDNKAKIPEVQTREITCTRSDHCGWNPEYSAAKAELDPIMHGEQDLVNPGAEYIWFSITIPWNSIGRGKNHSTPEILPCTWKKIPDTPCPRCSSDMFTIQDSSSEHMSEEMDHKPPTSAWHRVTDWIRDTASAPTSGGDTQGPQAQRPSTSVWHRVTDGVGRTANAPASGGDTQGFQAKSPPFRIEYESSHEALLQQGQQATEFEGILQQRFEAFTTEELAEMQSYVEDFQRAQDMQKIDTAEKDANLLWYMADLERRHPIIGSIFEDSGPPPRPVHEIVADFLAWARSTGRTYYG